MTSAAQRAYESLDELTLVYGNRYEVGLNADGVSGTEVLFIRRYAAHGNIQVAVRMPDGSVINNLFKPQEVAPKLGDMTWD